MTNIVGGLRARLIRESLYQLLNDNLSSLGWFNSGRYHGAISFNSEPVSIQDEIPLNTLALSDDEMDDEFLEMGSNLSENSWTFYVDFYAESDALGLHLIRDIRDILGGRYGSSLSRDRSAFPVYDYRQATPSVAFYCDIENVFVDKALAFQKPWQKHWYSCQFQVIDSYADEVY